MGWSTTGKADTAEQKTQPYKEGGKGTARRGHGVWARTALTVEGANSFFSPP